MINKFGVQTFTVRKHLKTPSELKTTFLKLYEIGYTHFELARLDFNEANFEVLKALQKEKGLVYTTSQIEYKVIKNNFDFLMKFSNELNITSIEVSVIPIQRFFQKKQGMLLLAKELNELGRKTKEHGVNLLFHHHNFELVSMDDKLGIEHLMDNTDSSLVNFVADTYWLASSGYDPYTFINNHIDRIKGIHLRDSMLTSNLLFFKCNDTVIGIGSIDFRNIVNLDVDFFSVEQASPNPFVDLETSLNYLQNLE